MRPVVAWAAVAFLFWFGSVALLVEGDWLWIAALGLTWAAGRRATSHEIWP